MKVKLAATFLILFFLFFTINPPAYAGAYDELLPTIVKGRPLVFSGKARVEYDDNIYASEEDEVGSWVLSIEPKVDYRLLRDQTYFGLAYQFSYRWFDNRPEDNEDLSHDVILDLRHMFTNRFEIRLRNVYRDRQDAVDIEEQITDIEEEAPPETAGRRDINESYQRNNFNSSLIYNASERLNLIGSFSHLWLDYDDEDRSINNDRTEYTIGGRIEYIWKPRTALSLGYMFQDVDYDENITKVDSTSHRYYGGVNHSFSPKLTGNFNIGWQERTFDSYTIEGEDGEPVVIEEKDQTAPYVDMSLSSPLSEVLSASIGYGYTISETDQSMFLSEERQTFYLSLTNKFSERLSLRFNSVMTFGTFDVDQARVPTAPENMKEDTTQFAIVFRYQIKPGWFAETGWRYTDVDSDFPGSSYERNRTFVGLNAVF